MKNTRKCLVIIALTAIIGFSFVGCGQPGGTDGGTDNNNPAVIDIAAIAGVTAPVTGVTPVSTITATTQYTGTVAWDKALDNNGKFAASTVYTATITLAPKTGFTLQGVAADFFTVTDATTVNNDANSGKVTAVFPKTGGTADNPAVIDIVAIPGVTAPVTGATPVSAITATTQYTGTVTWDKALDNGKFAAGMVYTATITLTAKTGFTLQGVAADFFTVDGATATNDANSGVVKAVFPETGTPADDPTQSFNITFEQIADSAPSITGTTISLTGSKTLSVSNPTQYSSIKWNITGRGITESGDSFTVNPANDELSVGKYHLTVDVIKDGVPYNTTVIITIEE